MEVGAEEELQEQEVGGWGCARPNAVNWERPSEDPPPISSHFRTGRTAGSWGGGGGRRGFLHKDALRKSGSERCSHSSFSSARGHVAHSGGML